MLIATAALHSLMLMICCYGRKYIYSTILYNIGIDYHMIFSAELMQTLGLSIIQEPHINED